jgi:ketosteroid isomerase-like protein
MPPKFLPSLLAVLLVSLAPIAHAADAERAAIDRTLDALHAAAAQADGARYFALFAEDAVFIGTDAAERWPLAAFKAYAEPFFARGKGWTYHPRERHVQLAALPCRCIAWFDELLDSESYGTSRGTGVLAKHGEDWKIAQYALTFPIPNDLAARMTAEIRAFEQARPAQP